MTKVKAGSSSLRVTSNNRKIRYLMRYILLVGCMTTRVCSYEYENEWAWRRFISIPVDSRYISRMTGVGRFAMSRQMSKSSMRGIAPILSNSKLDCYCTIIRVNGEPKTLPFGSHWWDPTWHDITSSQALDGAKNHIISITINCFSFLVKYSQGIKFFFLIQ